MIRERCPPLRLDALRSLRAADLTCLTFSIGLGGATGGGGGGEEVEEGPEHILVIG